MMILVASSLSASTAQGGDKAKKAFSIDDIVGLESARSFAVSPRDDWAAWIRMKSDKEKNEMVGNLFLASLNDAVSLQLTRGGDGAASPKFSPDGSHLAYLFAAGKEKPQIYLYDMLGGAPDKLTSVERGVKSFEWRGKGEILFIAEEDSTLRERKLKEEKDDVIVVADQEHYGPVRLFSVSLDDKEVKRITLNDHVITEFGVSPDGRWVVLSENIDVDFDYDNKTRPVQRLLDLQTNRIREIFTEPYLDPRSFEWAHDGKGFYCTRALASDSTDDYVSISHLWYYDMENETLRPVSLFWERGLYIDDWHVADGGVLVTLADGSRNRVAFIERKGRSFSHKFVESPSRLQIRTLAGRPNGNRIVYSIANASTMPRVMTAELMGGKLKRERELAELNGAVKDRILVRSEIVTWIGARGDQVEGILYYPNGYEEGRSYPLMVDLHGGPAGADLDFFSDSWSKYPHLLGGRGIAVLMVNYHGSGNFGLEWVESIKGHYYEYEIPDILTGVDMLVEKGIAHPDSLGIMGWSNGSILAIAACLETDRFKVFCAGAGLVNWISDYGDCAFGAGFDNAYLGGPPWEKPDVYIEKSLLFRMQEMKTPTLIWFGTNDTHVHTEQGWEHFRAMQQSGVAPVRFMLFPGAAHGPTKLSHRKRKMAEELAWIDRYLLGKVKDVNEAFDEKSPLAYEIKKAGAARSERLFGEMTNGVLVPETAELAGVLAGRFEVTRAQYAAFDNEYEIPHGTENWPASGISFEAAADYCEWLSEETGRMFRLPTEKEMKKLISAAAGNAAGENNLDWWAGYELTPDEVSPVMDKVAELEEQDLLLKECGSFTPVGEPGLWDLAGNAAEWAVAEDGTGKAMGLSAVSPRDKRCGYKPLPLRYTGFRIVEAR